MRGVGHSDAIESVTFTHEEANEGKKKGVKRGFGTFYGAKLLKKQEQHSKTAEVTTAPPGSYFADCDSPAAST
jgi:hypothetical protein